MAKRSSGSTTGKLRIIGGRWRGRRFPCPPGDLVRPTGDRVRETVFNWLAPFIEGARCLDLFAGTGALGLEALSRGASEVVFVERDGAAVRRLESTLDELNCNDSDVIGADALKFLAGRPELFDVVFLDPPFGVFDLENLCTLLDDGWLADGARIYIEMSRGHAELSLPPGWAITREKKAGQVNFMLVHRAGDKTGR